MIEGDEDAGEEGGVNRCLTEEEEEEEDESGSDEFYDAEDEPSMIDVVPSVSVATPEGVASGRNQSKNAIKDKCS